mmetsp:Transcript_49094/g.126600  ORF Transcript_49094/g.126600 Transcript_49094/m.126600 type:complete len:217 (+) Transcript_49094:1977-2627(+)
MPGLGEQASVRGRQGGAGRGQLHRREQHLGGWRLHRGDAGGLHGARPAVGRDGHVLAQAPVLRPVHPGALAADRRSPGDGNLVLQRRGEVVRQSDNAPHQRGRGRHDRPRRRRHRVRRGDGRDRHRGGLARRRGHDARRAVGGRCDDGVCHHHGVVAVEGHLRLGHHVDEGRDAGDGRKAHAVRLAARLALGAGPLAPPDAAGHARAVALLEDHVG